MIDSNTLYVAQAGADSGLEIFLIIFVVIYFIFAYINNKFNSITYEAWN